MRNEGVCMYVHAQTLRHCVRKKAMKQSKMISHKNCVFPTNKRQEQPKYFRPKTEEPKEHFKKMPI